MACNGDCYNDRGIRICEHPLLSESLFKRPTNVIDLARPHIWNNLGICVRCGNGKSYCQDNGLMTCPVDLSSIISKDHLELMSQIKDSYSELNIQKSQLQRDLGSQNMHQDEVDKYKKKVEEDTAKILAVITILTEKQRALYNAMRVTMEEKIEQTPISFDEIGRTE